MHYMGRSNQTQDIPRKFTFLYLFNFKYIHIIRNRRTYIYVKKENKSSS